MSTEYLHKREARLWVLGADDPEMQAIERLLLDANECYHYAAVRDPKGAHRRLHDTGYGGSEWNYRRVTPGEAYGGKEALDLVYGHCPEDLGNGCPLHIIAVECDASGWTYPEFWGHGGFGIGESQIDHHRPGDPGFGKPPHEYWEASSVGQVWNLLGRENTHAADCKVSTNPTTCDPVMQECDCETRSRYAQLQLVAAADHCLAAAYAGKCQPAWMGEPDAYPHDSRPRFTKDQLFDYRVSVLAQPAPGRPARTEEEVRASILKARYFLETRRAMQGDTEGELDLVDLRGEGIIPDLPEAACRLGVGYISDAPSRDGERKKVVIGGCGEGTVPGKAPVEWFLSEGYRAMGLVDPYGDPVRGFAGAYFPEQQKGAQS